MKNYLPKLPFLIIIIVLTIVAASLSHYLYKRNNPNIQPSPTASQSPTLAASAENFGDVGEYYAGPDSSSSSASPTPTLPSIKIYTYPGAQTASQAANKLELESTKTVESVTNWYKDKIKELKFNAKSFSQINTEGSILNKLTAVKPGEKIEITIKKDQTGSKVLISVDRS